MEEQSKPLSKELKDRDRSSKASDTRPPLRMPTVPFRLRRRRLPPLPPQPQHPPRLLPHLRLPPPLPVAPPTLVLPEPLPPPPHPCPASLLLLLLLLPPLLLTLPLPLPLLLLLLSLLPLLPLLLLLLLLPRNTSGTWKGASPVYEIPKELATRSRTEEVSGGGISRVPLSVLLAGD
jgi:hypothetical protein